MWEAIGDHFTKKKSSIVGNLLTGQPWNLNTRYGLQSPLSSKTKLGQFPEVKMPKEIKKKAPIVKFSTPTPMKPTVQKVTPTQIPMPTPNPKYTVDPAFEETLNTYVFPHTRKEKIPDAVAAGQTGVESGYGRSQAAINQRNLHGIMQWDAQGKRSLRTFSSASDSAKMYAQTVTKLLKEKGYDIRKMNASQILDALQDPKGRRYEGDKPDPYEYARFVKSLSAYKRYDY